MLQKVPRAKYLFRTGQNCLQNLPTFSGSTEVRLEGSPIVLLLADSCSPGKRSFGVNLKTKEGQDLVRKLVEQADVLVSLSIMPIAVIVLIDSEH